MTMNTPSKKTLTLAWLVMMGLSLGTMVAGRVTQSSALGPLFIMALFAITFAKASWILRYFLNLRASTRGWNRAFSAYLFVLLATIVAIYIFSWMV